jgi:hypothetical protein
MSFKKILLQLNLSGVKRKYKIAKTEEALAAFRKRYVVFFADFFQLFFRPYW